MIYAKFKIKNSLFNNNIQDISDLLVKYKD